MLLKQITLTFKVTLGIPQVRSGFSQLSLGSAEIGVLGTRIEREQSLSLTHELPFLDVH